MITRRSWLSRAALAAGGAALLDRFAGAFGRGSALADSTELFHDSSPTNPEANVPGAQVATPIRAERGYTPVVTPNGRTLPFVLKGGVKEFHLIAEPVRQEFAPGMVVNAWGYNGSAPGPTIEAVEGDRVRLLVTNRLPEPTTIHWHGVFTPNGMDGVGGLLQPHIAPGETYAYEFTLHQHGTFMYHPHSDEMIQMAMGMMGFFVIHARASERRIDRDFAIFTHMWAIEPGTATPNPNVMLDFNLFTFNGRAYPGTAPLLAHRGDRVRLRFANVSMTSHPIHIHGHRFWVVETDGGEIPESARWPATTIDVASGATVAVDFVADNPGDWPLHCHKTHHAMNAMSHTIPNVIGSQQEELAAKIAELVPGSMTMGSTGMAEHAEHIAMGHSPGLPNTLPMMAGSGPFGPIQMGGMFTVIKVREELSGDADPGWYRHPEGTVARIVSGEAAPEHHHHPSPPGGTGE